MRPSNTCKPLNNDFYSHLKVSHLILWQTLFILSGLSAHRFSVDWETKNVVFLSYLCFRRSMFFAKFMMVFKFFPNICCNIQSLWVWLHHWCFKLFVIFAIMTHLTRIWYFHSKKFVVSRGFNRFDALWRDFLFPVPSIPLKPSLTPYLFKSCAFLTMLVRLTHTRF